MPSTVALTNAEEISRILGRMKTEVKVIRVFTLMALAYGVLSLGALRNGAEAQVRKLRGQDLLRFVAGSTVYLKTPLGALPIKYKIDGTMTGRSKRLAMYTGSVSDKGKWWIRGDRLCQRWNKWLDKERQCFSLRAKGTKVYWKRNDGKKGTARVDRKPLVHVLIAGPVPAKRLTQ